MSKQLSKDNMSQSHEIDEFRSSQGDKKPKEVVPIEYGPDDEVPNEFASGQSSSHQITEEGKVGNTVVDKQESELLGATLKKRATAKVKIEDQEKDK